LHLAEIQLNDDNCYTPNPGREIMQMDKQLHGRFF